jgi:hypothetical protein
MVKSNKKIVAGTEYYDTNNDLQVRGSENEIRRITYADNPNVTGVVRTSSILKSLHLSSGKGSLKKLFRTI